MAFGDIKGTFSNNAASITNPFVTSTLISGSGSVAVGDLIYAVINQQTNLTATACTDNLGNTYTATNAGVDSGSSTGRAWYSRVTVAGTFTGASFTTTASANNVTACAVIFEGPFTAPPIDANPANVSDAASPFTGPATGTLAQANELVVAWGAAAGNAVWTATEPNVKRVEVASAALVKSVIGSQVVAATTSVQPAWTGTNPTDNTLGTTSFKQAAAAAPDIIQPPLSEPVRRNAITAAIIASGMVVWSAHTPTPAAPGNDDVVASASVQPVPHERTVLYPSLQQPTPFVVSEIVTVDKWYRPIAEPVRIPERLLEARQLSLVWSAFTPEPSLASWHRQLEEPMRREVRPQPDAFIYGYFSPESVTIDKWHQPLSEPVRIKVDRQAGVVVYSYFVEAFEQVTLDKYYRPFGEPVRFRVAQQQQSLIATLKPEPGTSDTDVSEWHRQLSEPVRTKPKTHPAALAWGIFTPAGTPGTDDTRPDQWWRPLAEPTRRKVRQQPAALTYANFVPAPSYGWFTRLADPVRRKVRPQPPALLYGYTEVVTVDRWLRSLVEPTRRNIRPPPDALVYGYFTPELVTLDKWHQPLAEPVRRRLLGTASQSTIAWVAFVAATPGNDDTELDEYYRPLDRPTLRSVRAQPDAVSYSYMVVDAVVPVRLTKSSRDQRDLIATRNNKATGKRANLATDKRHN